MYGWQAVGTHPTGMLSCYIFLFQMNSNSNDPLLSISVFCTVGYPKTQAKTRNMEPPVPAPVPVSAPAAPDGSKVQKNNSSRDHYHYKVGPPGEML